MWASRSEIGICPIKLEDIIVRNASIHLNTAVNPRWWKVTDQFANGLLLTLSSWDALCSVEGKIFIPHIKAQAMIPYISSLTVKNSCTLNYNKSLTQTLEG